MKKVISVSLEEYQIEDIQKMADERHDTNFSSAIRWIINDWRYLTAKQVALGKRPAQERNAADYEGAGGG